MSVGQGLTTRAGLCVLWQARPVLLRKGFLCLSNTSGEPQSGGGGAPFSFAPVSACGSGEG